MKRSQKLVCAAVLLAGLAGATGVGADPPVTRAEVEAALAGYEDGVRPEVVRGWGVAGAAHLAALGDDVGALLFVRVRAVYALRLAAGTAAAESTRARLGSVLGAEGNPLMLRRAAMDALCEGFDAVSEVAPFLGHADPGMREGAGRALVRAPSPAGRAAVRAHLGRERDAGVRQSLTEALGVQAPTTPTQGRAGVSRGG